MSLLIISGIFYLLQMKSYCVDTVPLETIATLDAVFPRWLDTVLPQIGCSTTSKGMRRGCGKDAPSFAAVNSGCVRILNRCVSNVSC